MKYTNKLYNYILYYFENLTSQINFKNFRHLRKFTQLLALNLNFIKRIDYFYIKI